MKMNAALSALLFLLLAMLGNWPASASTVYDGMQTQYPVADFAPVKPTGPRMFDEALARVYIRFDDGRLGEDAGNPVKKQIAAFLRRGLAVAVSLNADNIGESGYMTWADIRDLQAFARLHGTTLHIIQHTNGNFETPFLLTHDEIVAELETSEIFAETGYRPRFLAIPGDAGRREFFKRNRQYMQSVADSLGLWYTDYNTGLSQTTGDSTFSLSFEPAVVDLDNYAAQRSNFKTPDMGWMSPMSSALRTELLSSTFDLGTVAVERVGSWPSQYDSASHFTPLSHYLYGSWNITGVEPPRAVSEWTMTGKGGAANATGLYRKTWANMYSSALATNRGFAVVLHDSASARTGDFATGITATEYNAGGLSPEHMAWTLAMLQAKGHIKVVGPEEWAEWVTGEYAPGTDLINNPRMIIPQFDIGDTLGATSEYAIIRGLGTNGVNITNHSATSQFGSVPIENTGNVAKYVRRVGSSSADSPYYAIGDSVTGVRGRSGGAQMFADGSNPGRVRLVFGNLRPGGRYLFSVDMLVPSLVSPVAEEYHLTWMGKFHKIADSVAAGFAPAFRDTAISWQWRDADTTLNPPAFAETKWQSFQVPFQFPYTPPGETTATASYGSVSEATGTRLFKPLATNASQGVLVDSKWAWALVMNGQGATRLSNPRLIYLGQQ